MLLDLNKRIVAETRKTQNDNVLPVSEETGICGSKLLRSEARQQV